MIKNILLRSYLLAMSVFNVGGKFSIPPFFVVVDPALSGLFRMTLAPRRERPILAARSRRSEVKWSSCRSASSRLSPEVREADRKSWVCARRICWTEYCKKEKKQMFAFYRLITKVHCLTVNCSPLISDRSTSLGETSNFRKMLSPALDGNGDVGAEVDDGDEFFFFWALLALSVMLGSEHRLLSKMCSARPNSRRT